MTNNSQETGELSITQAMDSLLATPPEQDTESEGRQGEELENEAPTLETEAEVYEADEAEYSSDEDEGEYEDDAEYEDEQEEQPLVFTVKVDGEELEVTQDELINGYSRQSSYTKRTQELAEQRKAFEAEAAQVSQMRNEYAQQLEELSQYLGQVNSAPEPDWGELAKQHSAEDLIVYKAQLDQQKEYARQIEEEKQKVQQQQMAEQQKHMSQHLANQREEMLKRIPSWGDESTRNKERQEVITYAQSVAGFTPDEIANTADARAVELLYKAWQWDKLQSEKPAARKKARKAPKMARAGQPKTKKQVASRQRQQSLNKLNKERSVGAAVDYLMGR